MLLKFVRRENILTETGLCKDILFLSTKGMEKLLCINLYQLQMKSL